MAQMTLSEKQASSGKRYLAVAVIILLLLALLAGAFLFRTAIPTVVGTGSSAESASASGREATTLNVPAAGSFASPR